MVLQYAVVNILVEPINISMKIVKFYERGSLENNELIVQWNLGNTCNYVCEYCPSYLHSGKIQWPELSLIQQTLIKIKNNFPDKNIRLEFLGGEVTLYSDFIELMKFLCPDYIIPKRKVFSKKMFFYLLNLLYPQNILKFGSQF